MTQFKHFGARLAALGVSLALQGVALAGTDTPPTFRILSDQEVAAHTAMMNTLQGKAREEYRNAQYEQLKKRAMENGFRMPSTPPWAGMAMATTAAPQAVGSAATPADEAAEAAARHAAMRDKLKAHQDSAPAAADAKPVADTPPAAVDAGQAGVTIEPAPVVTTDAGGVAAEDTTQQDATGSMQATPEAAVAEIPATTTPPVTTPAASEPRFAPVEELNAAQALSTVPAAPPLPAAPPVPPEAPAMPPTPAEAPTIPPTPYAAGPVASPAPPAPAEPVAEASAPAPAAAAPLTGESGPAYGGADTVTAYRESMRARFEEYMKERQAQHEETMRRQREQHEAQMEQKRAEAGRNRPYPFPAMPAYGPRYPAAFPGYRTPYWQQQPPPPPAQ